MRTEESILKVIYGKNITFNDKWAFVKVEEHPLNWETTTHEYVALLCIL